MKNILIIFTALMATMGLQAQKLEKSLLWKISGNGVKTPSYLFGTMHITCNAELDKNTIKAMDETSQLYLELDMDDPALQVKMMSGLMMKDGKKMSNLASAEDYAMVAEFLTNTIGIPAALMDSFKPALVNAMLAEKMLDCPAQSFERNLMMLAQKQEEEIYGLETVEDQLSVFDAIPYEEQMEELISTARDSMASEKKMFNKLMDVYETKDLNKIMEIMNEQESDMYSGHADVLLINRNRKWICVIAAQAKLKPTFFAVGAAHLGGENGVIMLLRKEGYTVQAVQ